jgi:hypothetical protein
LRFKKLTVNGHYDAIAREIAERCAEAIVSKLDNAANRMSAAELRGYVRASAWPWICAEVQAIDSQPQLAKSERVELAARALEQTAHLVTRALMSAPIIAMPTPHIGQRAAA